MTRVFISYRRADSAAFAGRIYDRLTTHFGRQNVFKDVDNIPAGVNFETYLQHMIRQCDVALMLIGAHWLDARTDGGQRRLDDPGDSVRMEIEQALALGLTVIPVLIEETPMPTTAELPESLRDVVQLQALRVRNDPDFNHDIEHLIAALKRVRTAPPWQRQGGLFTRRTQPLPRVSGAPPTSPPAADGSAPTAPPVPAPVPAPVPVPASRRKLLRAVALAVPAVVIVVIAALVLPGLLLAGRCSPGSVACATTSVPPAATSGFTATTTGTPSASATGSPSATPTGNATGPGAPATSTPRVTPPLGWSRYPNSPTQSNINGIAMVSANEGWAVGNGGLILHYIGGKWIKYPNSPTTNDLSSVAMASPTDVWAVGGTPSGNGSPCGTSQGSGIILHYNGSQWIIYSQGTWNELASIAMLSATEGWIVGTCGIILQYSGGQWNPPSCCSPSSWNYKGLYSVAIVSSSEAWASGDWGYLHYSGGQWNLNPNQLPVETVAGIAVVSANDVWEVGDQGTIMQSTGGSWQEQPSPTLNTLSSVAMVSSSSGWTVGNMGTILQYTGGNWQLYQGGSSTSPDLNDIVMVSATAGWVVGNSGTILQFNGS